MKLASHNSWSYLSPKKWWMKAIRFTAQCQDWDIRTQYEHGVRGFDLRIRYDGYNMQIVHGAVVFDCDIEDIIKDLEFLNEQGGCNVRVLHDVRTKSQCNSSSKECFAHDCAEFERLFPNIVFWNGDNLYTRQPDYNFSKHIALTEKYSSVMGCKLDDLYPRAFAKKHNSTFVSEHDGKTLLMIDFVNIT